MSRFSRVLKITAFSVLLSLLAAGLSQAESFPLTLQRLDPWPENTSNENDSEFLYRMVYQQHFWMDQRGLSQNNKEHNYSSLVKKEPEKVQCDPPFKDVAKLGDDSFIFMLDSTDFAKQGFDLLYFDLNKNGDLTDDKVIKALGTSNSSSSYFRRQFPRVDVTVQAEGTSYPYSFFLSAYCNIHNQTKKLSYASISLRSAAYRSGEIQIAGKKHPFVVLDFNGNGRFDSEINISRYRRQNNGPEYVNASGGDMILIDPDLSDREVIGYRSIDRSERQELSKLLYINQGYYQAKITPGGDSVTLTPSGTRIGYIKNENKNYRATIYGDSGVIKITSQNSKEVPVPVGKWRLLDYIIDESPENQGSKKTYTYVKATAMGNYPEVEVKTGKSSLLPFGPPYKPQVKVSRVNQSGSEKKAYLELDIIGQAGEICSDMRIENKRPDKPLFAIATPKGKILERGNFEYG